MDASILFIGDRLFPEFAFMAQWLADRGAEVIDPFELALAKIRSGMSPAIIVVALPWPSHVSRAQIEKLRAHAPLSRIVSLLGTWVEGESRTGKPWTAVPRHYWHAWLPRFAAELERLQSGKSNLWSLPITASDEERTLQLCMPRIDASVTTRGGKTIAIFANDRETADSLKDVTRSQGWNVISSQSQANGQSADLVLLDCRQSPARDEAAIRQLKSRIGETPLVAIVGFPRIEDIKRLEALGVSAVVSKPYLLSDLIWQMNRLLER